MEFYVILSTRYKIMYKKKISLKRTESLYYKLNTLFTILAVGSGYPKKIIKKCIFAS